MPIKPEINISAQSVSSQTNEGIRKLNVGLSKDVAKDYLYAMMSIRSLVSGYYLDLNTGRSIAISQEKIYNERYGNEADWSVIDDYIRDCVHPDDQAAITAASKIDFIRECLKSTPEYSLELRDLASGRERWLRYTIMRCSDADHAAIVFRDITKAEHRRLELEHLNNEKEHNIKIIGSLAKAIQNLYYIDMKDFSFMELGNRSGQIESVTGKSGDAIEALEAMCQYIIAPECRDEMRGFLDLVTLDKRLRGKTLMTKQFCDVNGVWLQGTFTVVNHNKQGKCDGVLWSIRNIDESKQEMLRKETELEAQIEKITTLNEELANTKDELTKSLGISSALAASFKNIYLVDKKSRTIEVMKLDGYVTQGIDKSNRGPYSYDALVANYIQKRVLDDDKPFVANALNWDVMLEAVINNDSYQFTYRVLEDGEQHFYQGRFRNIDEQYIACGFQNIDDTIAQEKEYNDIIATAGFGVWHIYIKDGEASRMQANEKMAELLGIDASNMTEEEVYDAWYSRITPAAIPSVQKSVAEMLDGQFSENTYLWTHPTKGDIYVRCGGTAFKQADGSFVVRGYHADVTDIVFEEQKHNKELEKAKEAADAANNAKTSFLFNMSHDIRTPMNAIMGFRDMLEKHQDDPVRREDYLHKIEESSKILLSIINNVLEMARIEKGTLKVEEVAWSAEQFNDTLYSVFRDMMEQKGITFTRQIIVQNNFVFCDPIKLREIFINIISNAYKYTNPGGSVNMHLEEIPSDRKGWALYQTTISDTGIGMSKEFLPHLYDEFSRENNTTDAKVEGTGLGMPIVKRLVEILNGTIKVTSEKGKGTTFIVTIPHRIASKEELIDHSNVDVDPKLFEGKRILLTEDNDLNAEIATDALEEAGLKIERAEDGAVCCKMLEDAADGYYDLILMDIQMPNMNGYEATRKIRGMENRAKASIPIIAMTANAFEEDKREAVAAGMNGHLSKPIKARTLIREIANVLKPKQ